MGKDTDGTNWMTVRYTLDIDVIADDVDDAFYHANLKLAHYTVEDFYAEISSDAVILVRTQKVDN